MAYRELGMVEVREILRRWLSGDGVRAIARGTGLDRKTIAAYVGAALTVGVQREAPHPPTSRSPRSPPRGARAADKRYRPQSRSGGPVPA